jgi:hypothetical protein
MSNKATLALALAFVACASTPPPQKTIRSTVLMSTNKAGTQVVTVTSTQIPGASVSFVANNGAVITGNVSPALTNPFSPTFSRGGSQSLVSAARVPQTKPRRPSRIIVGLSWVWNYPRRSRPGILKLMEQHKDKLFCLRLKSPVEVDAFLEQIGRLR